MNFTFNSKETYSEYRRQWFKKYLKLVADIRRSKQELKDQMRAYSKEQKDIGALWKKHWQLVDARKAIEKHIEELQAAKAESWRQALSNVISVIQ
jgi:membrane-associated HD superfamily phosphohydrolase